MPKVEYEGHYEVSFNCEVGFLELGEASMNSIDYTGDDMNELAKEVCESDPKCPLIFIEPTDEERDATFDGYYGEVCGIFVDAKDTKDVIAVMFG